MTECVLIADDLTGACDAAGPFATAGLRTVAALQGEADAEVVALSTGSRDVEPDEARRRLREAGAVVRGLAPRIIFKKIDSTLRGNTRCEIEAALDAFDCDTAVVTPAFPAMGRVVESGVLWLTNDPRFAPIDLTSWFNSRFEIADATTDGELDAIADRLLARGPRVLWAGSAGLSGALARRMRRNPAEPPPALRGPLLFCVGSDHPVTVEQLSRLRAYRAADLLAIPRTGIDACAILDRRPGALFLCGGDTAAMVCDAIGVERIEIVGEFAPGIPFGTLRGGPLAGAAVVTKSGGFGKPDVLVALADCFSTL